MSPVVVHDKMQVEMGWCLDVNLLEEPDELLVSMPGHAVTDDFPIKHVQRCKQGSRAVAFVVMRHGPTAALLHRQTRRGSVEGLNLALLVNGETQELVRGIEVETDNIIEFFDELLIAADLEGPDKMGLEVVLFPDASDCGLAEPLCVCHDACAPMGCIGRCGMESCFDNRTDFALRNAGDTSWAQGIFFKPSHPQGKEPIPPQLDGWPRDIQPLRDILVRDAVSGHGNDVCALYEADRQTCCSCPSGQLQPLIGRQHNRESQMHNTYHSPHLFNC